MKLDTNKKYEACIAKTTLPKGWERAYFTVGKWYPVLDPVVLGSGSVYFHITDDEGDQTFHSREDAAHLEGGNWKIRQVKEKKCSK